MIFEKPVDKGKKLCYKESDLFRASEVDSNPSNPTYEVGLSGLIKKTRWSA